MKFIADYCILNQQLVINPYHLPIIGNTIQQLGVLQYVNALDINMGYYTIRLSPASQYMTTIVTEFGKFRYNRLPMGMCGLGDIFQAKVDDLPGGINGIKTHIDDILVLIKYCFKKHIDQLSIIFG